MFLWTTIKPYNLDFSLNQYDIYIYYKNVVNILEINKYLCTNLKTVKKHT